MATTSYAVNANEAVIHWRRRLFREALKATRFYQFIGEGTGNIIQMLDETSKGPGDQIHVLLRMQLTGDGIQGDATLEGNEESLTTYRDTLIIDQLRHAVRSGGQMSDQRIPFSVREEAYSGLRDWWAARIDQWICNQLAGNSVQTDTKFTGHNSVTAMDSNHLQLKGSDAGNLSASTTDVLTLGDIDKAVTTAKVAGNSDYSNAVPIRPINIKGGEYYCLFAHPYAIRELRRNTNTLEWGDIQRAAMEGGNVTGNPLFTGAKGVYNQTIIHEVERLPLAQSTAGAAQANTRVCVFAGAQAATMAFGRDDSLDQMSWVEEVFDYQNQLGVSAGMIGGVKRTIYNSNSFGSIAIPVYASNTAVNT